MATLLRDDLSNTYSCMKVILFRKILYNGTVVRSFDDEQSRCRWFETPWRPWRHDMATLLRDDLSNTYSCMKVILFRKILYNGPVVRSFDDEQSRCRWFETLWRPMRHDMATLLRDDLSNTYSCMKVILFRLRFHWNLFPGAQLKISQHWFRKWIATDV